MIKKITLAVAALLIITSVQAQESITFSGIVKNQKTDSLIVFNRGGIVKNIKLNADGSFSETFEAETGTYGFADGKQRVSLYLKKGGITKVTIDANDFGTSLKFTGDGAAENNYLTAMGKLGMEYQEEIGKAFDLDQAGFDKALDAIVAKFQKALDNTNDLDEAFKVAEQQQIARFKPYYSQMYKQQLVLKGMNGKPSPAFENYENHAGGELSLSDLKGKYVYIDLWATWCGPCIQEIPFLKKVEKEYHGKNIAFVSISIDQPAAYDKWKSMVAEKELTGIQLYAKGDQSFVSAYQVNGIPRFILIDPQGNVVDANAPRPSQPELKELFNKLNI